MADKKYSRADLEALAHQIAVRKGVSPALVKAVIEQESNWDPNIVSKVTDKTGRPIPGAGGLMQLMPDTARSLGLSEQDRFDPAKNIEAGVTYLQQQMRRFGDLGLALAAYNAGPGTVVNVTTNPRGNQFKNETLNYVPGVFKLMGKYGETIEPTAVTAALFPKVGGAIRASIGDHVSQRVGAAPQESIEQTLRAGKAAPPAPAAPVMPNLSGASMASAAVSPEMGGGGVGSLLTPPEITVPPVGVQSEVAAAPPSLSPTQALLSTPLGKSDTSSLQRYLREQFGPMGDVADPFSKAFDAELSRLIDRA